jgi:hypothetical protein
MVLWKWDSVQKQKNFFMVLFLDFYKKNVFSPDDKPVHKLATCSHHYSVTYLVWHTVLVANKQHLLSQTQRRFMLIQLVTFKCGARGGVRYKPAGRGFDSKTQSSNGWLNNVKYVVREQSGFM